MAHLVVSDKATALWEALHRTASGPDRPAMLDQTDGLQGNKQDIADRLLSVAGAIKDDLDLSVFSVDHCGAEASSAMAHIHASEAIFKSSLEILELYTSYVNQYDGLLSRLDSSGNFDTGLTRRMKCFDSFVGPPGKGRNVGLYYCFLLWEGNPTRLTSHRLGESSRRGSAGQVTATGAGDTSSFSKKEQKKMNMLSQILNGNGRASPPNFTSPMGGYNSDNNTLAGDGSGDKSLLEERKRLLIVRAQEAESNISSAKVAKLSKMMADPRFQFLTEQQQQEIQDDWFAEAKK